MTRVNPYFQGRVIEAFKASKNNLHETYFVHDAGILPLDELDATRERHFQLISPNSVRVSAEYADGIPTMLLQTRLYYVEASGQAIEQLSLTAQALQRFKPGKVKVTVDAGVATAMVPHPIPLNKIEFN